MGTQSTWGLLIRSRKMEVANFAPRNNRKYLNYLLIGSVALNVLMVLLICFGGVSSQPGFVAAPVQRRSVAPTVRAPAAMSPVSRGQVMKGAMAGVGAALAGAINKAALAGDVSEKSKKKICSANPTAA